jgi:hypothetical protein
VVAVVVLEVLEAAARLAVAPLVAVARVDVSSLLYFS